MRSVPPWLWLLGGVILLMTLGGVGVVTVNYLNAAWMSSNNAQKWAAALSQAEDLYGIPTGLLSRIAYQESRFRQDVIDGTNSSSAGALGMMQLMPQYFSTVTVPIPFSDTDTGAQINEAANFLAGLYNHFQNWTAAVAAYNAGQGTINQVLAGARALPNQTATYLQQVAADLPHIVSPTLNA